VAVACAGCGRPVEVDNPLANLRVTDLKVITHGLDRVVDVLPEEGGFAFTAGPALRMPCAGPRPQRRRPGRSHRPLPTRPAP